jgi:hypothetical protein
MASLSAGIVLESAPWSSTSNSTKGARAMTDQQNGNLDRRAVLLGAGTAAAAGVVAAFGTSPAEAQGRVDQECMTIVYRTALTCASTSTITSTRTCR